MEPTETPAGHAAAAAQGDVAVPQKKPRKPDRRRALTRRAIVEAAATLFAQRGVEATTVDEIAEAAELSVGTLYFHFGSKENVELALVSEVLASTETYLTAGGRSDSALARLLESGDVYLAFAMEQPVAFRLVSSGLQELPGDAPDHAVEALQAIATRVRAFMEAVRDDLQQAMADGEIDAVPVDEAFAFVWGAWNGVAGLMMRGDEFAISADLGERALGRGRAILVKGLGGTAPDDRR